MVRLDFSQFKREVDALQAPDELEARILDHIADNQHRGTTPCERNGDIATPPRHRWKLRTAISAAACLMVAVVVCASIAQPAHRNPEIISGGSSPLNDAEDAAAGSYISPFGFSGELVINADTLSIRKNDECFIGRLHLRFSLDEGISDQMEVLASEGFTLLDASESYESGSAENEFAFDLYADPRVLGETRVPTADVPVSPQQLVKLLKCLGSLELIAQDNTETAVVLRLDGEILESIVQRLERGENPPWPLTLPFISLSQ